MKIVYQDSHFFVVDKPAGFFVHPPEVSPYPVPREKICLYQLRKQFNQEVFPAHRLDAPTTGLVLFGFSRESVRELTKLFKNREIEKTYRAVTRGFVDQSGEINIPLEIAGFENLSESLTRYRCLKTLELPHPVGKRYPTARYSLVEVKPQTGRWHQIRRHFDRISHPLIGDIEHGDTHHNRFFRDQLKIKGLCLRAMGLQFKHPWSHELLQINAEPTETWQKIESLFI